MIIIDTIQSVIHKRKYTWIKVDNKTYKVPLSNLYYAALEANLMPYVLIHGYSGLNVNLEPTEKHWKVIKIEK